MRAGRPAAAASGEGAGAVDASVSGKNLFVVSTQKLTPQGGYAGTYLQTVSALEGAIDLGQAVELGPGYWYVTSSAGAVLVGSPSNASVTRYVPDERDVLQRAAAISFQPDGARAVLSIAVVSPTLAVTILGDAGKIVLFNPTTMQKVPGGVIDIAAMRLDGIDPASHAPQVVGGKAYFPTFYVDRTTFRTRKQVQVIIVDPQARTARLIEDDRCAHAQYLAVDDQGDIYVQGDNLGQLVEGPPTCLVKIRAGTEAFDKTWFLGLADILGGRETTVLAHLGAGRFATLPLYPERVDPMDPLGHYFGPVRRWWTFDVHTRRGEEVAGLPFTGHLFWPLELDGETHVSTGSALDGTTKNAIWILSPDGGVVRKFDVPGTLNHIGRLR